MRELVQEIDSHVELVDLEVTSNLRTRDQPDDAQIQLPTIQPIDDAVDQQAEDATQLPPMNPTS